MTTQKSISCEISSHIPLIMMRKYAEENFWGSGDAAPAAPATPAADNFWAHGHSATPMHAAPERGFDYSALSRPVAEIGVRHGIGPPAVRHGLSRFLPSAIQQALPQAATQAPASFAGRLAARALPSGSGMGVGTILNSGADLLDAAGVYSIDQSKPNPHFWLRPQTNAQGQRMHDDNGTPQNEYGWNPSAFGWNTDEFRQGTTPNQNIIGPLSTGNRYADTLGSYSTSAVRAYTNPLKSMGSIFQQGQMLAPQRASEGGSFGALYSGGNDIGQMNESYPLRVARSIAHPAHTPSNTILNNPELRAHEAAPYLRNNTYHSVYNPNGANNRPGNALSRFFNNYVWSY